MDLIPFQDYHEYMKQRRMTPKQREILRLYATGLTQKQVADQLGVSNATIWRCLNKYQDHLERLMEAMDKIAIDRALVLSVLRLRE